MVPRRHTIELPGKDRSSVDNTAPSETTAPDRRHFLRTLGAGGVASALAVAISASRANASQMSTPNTNAASVGGNAGSAGGSGAGEGSGSNGSNGGQSGATPNSISPDGSDTSIPVTAGGSAATATASTAPAPATTTTIAAPAQPIPADLPLLKFALQYELAIAGTYDAAISRLDDSSLPLDAALVPVVRVFRQHHIAYGQALSGLIGKTAPVSANQVLLKSMVGPFQAGAPADFLTAAAALENTAVATHLSILAKIASTDGATLLASIVPIEARHAIVFELALGSTELIPTTGTENLTLALDPSKYPAE